MTVGCNGLIALGLYIAACQSIGTLRICFHVARIMELPWRDNGTKVDASESSE